MTVPVSERQRVRRLIGRADVAMFMTLDEQGAQVAARCFPCCSTMTRTSTF
jgi:hypothetical protein